MDGAGLLAEPDHPLHGRARLLLQPEGQGQVEQQFRVGRADDPGVEGCVDGEDQVALDPVDLPHRAVVNPQHVAVADRVAVGLLHRIARGAQPTPKPSAFSVVAPMADSRLGCISELAGLTSRFASATGFRSRRANGTCGSPRLDVSGR
jgi:hypothetical protein